MTIQVPWDSAEVFVREVSCLTISSTIRMLPIDVKQSSIENNFCLANYKLFVSNVSNVTC